TSAIPNLAKTLTACETRAPMVSWRKAISRGDPAAELDPFGVPSATIVAPRECVTAHRIFIQVTRSHGSGEASDREVSVVNA
ncbi:MAG: hypothetical protein ACRDSH_05480, partial [Pseudonocardiaceae bacterium]